MRRAPLALLVGAAVVATTAPSSGAPPKPITQTIIFRDATPDPTGIAVGSDGHCSGLLPREAPHAFQAPARGTLKVSISGFTGEWAMQLRGTDDKVLAETDVAPPDFETLTLKVRKPTTINVLPCNLAGTVEATVQIVFTFS